MKTLLPFLITTFLLSGYASIKEVQVNRPVQIAQSTWKQFSSSEGGFRVLMPGTPVVMHTHQGLAVDKPTMPILVPIHTYVVRAATRGQVPGYWVMYYELPHKISNSSINQVLTQAFETGVVHLLPMRDRSLSQRTISLGNYPGKEFTYKCSVISDLLITVRVRAYVVEQRLYLIGAETADKSNLTRSTEGFLNSFQLLNSLPPKKNR